MTWFVSGLDECNKTLEELYVSLEKLLYYYCIDLKLVMGYIIIQTGVVNRTDMFFQWVDYLELCEKIDYKDKTPEFFPYSYNKVLEFSGKDPIIYEITEIDYCKVYIRSGRFIEFEGVFPCDDKGNIMFKWIGLNVRNAKSIECSKFYYLESRIKVELSPNTIIYALNCYNYKNEKEDNWYQIYAGPQLMDFDYSILKDKRKQLNYTQKEVAESIKISIRTYQKWEKGITIPDGYNLLKLLNLLDVEDIQDIIKYRDL